MTLVLDANVVVGACLAAGDSFGILGADALLAPDLMWWEAASTLYEYLWRSDSSRVTPQMGTLLRDDVLLALERLQSVPIEWSATTVEALADAWLVASRCGFARLYDASYAALAIRTSATRVTLDDRLRGGPAAKVVRIAGPVDLGA